jgi:hypothetical protein
MGHGRYTLSAQAETSAVESQNLRRLWIAQYVLGQRHGASIGHSGAGQEHCRDFECIVLG